MSTPKATGRITVIKTPQGEPPENIRAAWVGETLPCYPRAGYPVGTEVGVLSGQQERANGRRCVIVPQREALEILARRKPEAAQWWHEHGYPLTSTAEFTFDLDEVSIVSGVSLKTVIEVGDDMQGDPYR